MTKQEIYNEVRRLLFEESSELDRSEYQELLSDVEDDCNSSLAALDQDDVEEE